MEKFRDLIGLSEQDAVIRANSKGYKLRVMYRDGESLGSDTRFISSRLNVSVQNGTVIELLWIG